MGKKKGKAETFAEVPASGEVQSDSEITPISGGRPLAINPGATVETHVEEPTRERYAEAITSVCRQGGLAAGIILIDAKEKLKHGDFEGMIEKDLPFGPRTAE